MKNFSSKYLLILGGLSIVILVSQLLIQKTIRDNESDSRIINISGRQRMLSQKITKAALKLTAADNLASFDLALTELKESTDLLLTSHQALQEGNKDMKLTDIKNSETVKSLFSQVEPSFQALSTASIALQGLDFNTMKESLATAKTAELLQQITSNEKPFLKLMNEITFQYDKEASMKINKLSTSEYYLLGFTFLLILIEAFFIFRPMAKSASEKELEVSALNQRIEASTKVLGKREEEKKYAASQITMANEKIAELRKLAFDLQEKMEINEKRYAIDLSKKMSENLQLSENYARALNQIAKSESKLSAKTKEMYFTTKQAV